MIQRNIFFPNVWFVRKAAFWESHPTKKIFPSRQGQNWQLLLPLAYRFKCGYIDEPLCVYVERRESHSHEQRNLQQQIERNLGFVELLTETLKPLHTPNEKELLNFVWTKYLHLNLVLGINHGNADIIFDCCRKAQEKNLNIFGADYFDVANLLNRYILPRITLQQKLNELKSDISKINDKLK